MTAKWVVTGPLKEIAKPLDLRRNTHAMTTLTQWECVEQRNARQLFKLKAGRIHKVYSIRQLCFTAADAAHTCNGNVLVGDEHREKDTSAHDVEKHDSNACNLSMKTVMDGWLVLKGTR